MHWMNIPATDVLWEFYVGACPEIKDSDFCGHSKVFVNPLFSPIANIPVLDSVAGWEGDSFPNLLFPATSWENKPALPMDRWKFPFCPCVDCNAHPSRNVKVNKSLWDVHCFMLVFTAGWWSEWSSPGCAKPGEGNRNIQRFWEFICFLYSSFIQSHFCSQCEWHGAHPTQTLWCLTPATKPREFSPIFLPPAPAPAQPWSKPRWKSGKSSGQAQSLTHKPPPHTSSMEGKLCRCNWLVTIS